MVEAREIDTLIVPAAELIEELLGSYADGSALADAMHNEDDGHTVQASALWWIAVFKHKAAVEETIISDAVEAISVITTIEAKRETQC